MVPKGSTWRIGWRLRRPSCSAVGSPSRLATSPCATSWKTIAITSGTSHTAIWKTMFWFIRPLVAGALRPRQSEAQLARFAFLQPLEEMLAAERDITVVAADLGLGSGGDGMALGIDSKVHRRLAPAFANRLQFDQRIRQGEQRGA